VTSPQPARQKGAKRAVIYARYSSPLQSPASIEDQNAEGKRYIKRIGLDFCGAYSDSSLHAEAIEHRPGLLRLLDDMERKQFDVIVIEQIDRLARSLGDAASMYEVMQFLGVELHTPTGGPVTSIEVAFKGWQAAEHNKDLAVKVRRGLEGKIRRGGHVGKVPFGYKLVYTKDETPVRVRVIDPAAAAVVRRIFEEYLSGVGSTEICWRLNAEGIAGPRGGDWRPHTLLGDIQAGTGILRNPLYVGKVRFGALKQKKDPRTGRRKNIYTDPSTHLWHDEPKLRIVDQELYDRVQQRLSEQGGRRLDARRAPKFLFSGVIKCGLCGGGYVQSSDATLVCSWRLYKRTCNNTRRLERTVVEDAVLDGLRRTLLQPALVAKFAETYLDEAKAWKNRMSADQVDLAAALSDVETAIRNLVERLKRATPVIEDLLMTELNGLGQRKTELEARIAAANNVAPEVPNPEALAMRLQEQVSSLRSQLSVPGAEGERARNAIRALVDKIEITPLPSPTAKEYGARNASITITGPIVQLLNLANSGSEKMIVVHEGTLIDHYPNSARYSFKTEVGADENRTGTRSTETEAQILAELSTAGRPLRPRDLVAAIRRHKHAHTEPAVKLQGRIAYHLARMTMRGTIRRVSIPGARRPGIVLVEGNLDRVGLLTDEHRE